MVKTKIGISVNPDILERAKYLGLNVSGECEHALRLRTGATKKDAPEEQIRMKCYSCKKIVEEGYLCKDSNRFVCLDCHTDWNCHVNEDMHEHIRLPYKVNRDDNKVKIND